MNALWIASRLAALLRQLELPLGRHNDHARALKRRLDLAPRIITHLVATLETANGRRMRLILLGVGDEHDGLSNGNNFLTKIQYPWRQRHSIGRCRILTTHGEFSAIFELRGQQREQLADHLAPMLLMLCHGATKQQKLPSVHPQLSVQLAAECTRLPPGVEHCCPRRWT